MKADSRLGAERRAAREWELHGAERRLRAHQPDERADDAVKLLIQLLALPDVAEDRRDFETRQRLARRAERGVVARGPIVTAAVHASPGD